MSVHANDTLPDGKPIVGQTVHYVSDGGVCTAALVTAVDGTDPYKASLYLYLPNMAYYQLDVPADLDNLTDGTWHTVGAN